MSSSKKFKISGTGCALVDYLYKPVNFNDAGFKKYFSKKRGDGGLSPGKLVFTEEFEKFSGEEYLKVREKITKGMQPVAVNIGGPSVVSLIHAAQMLHGLPAEVWFYGCRGSDEGGAFIEKRLEQTPLKIGKFKTGKQYSPFTDVLSDPEYDRGNGERIFLNNIGAAWELLPPDLDDDFFESDIVVFGGTALVPNIHNALRDLVKKAKMAKTITVVNTVYDFLNEKSNPARRWPLGESDETYRYIDLLITDKEESLRLSGTASIEEAIRFFMSSGVGALIVTHGSNDIHFFTDSALFGKIAPATLPVSERVSRELRQNPKKAGDTTGCGDNFAGGVIASLAEQFIVTPGKSMNFREALAMGVASGGFACFYHGGTFYEKFPGQKSELIRVYINEYKRQTGL